MADKQVQYHHYLEYGIKDEELDEVIKYIDQLTPEDIETCDIDETWLKVLHELMEEIRLTNRPIGTQLEFRFSEDFII